MVPAVFQKYGHSFLRQFEQFLETSPADQKENAALTEREWLSLLQIVSAVLSLCLPLDFFHGFSGIDPKDPVMQMVYIDHLLTRYLNWVDPHDIQKDEQKVAQLLVKIKNTQVFDRPD